MWGLKYTFMNAMLKYNTVSHTFCSLAKWMLEVAKGELYAEILVNECIWGLVSYFDDTEDAITCEWVEYAIQDPIIGVNLSDYMREGAIMPDTCKNNFTSLIQPDSGVIYEDPVWDDEWSEVIQ